MSLKKMFLWPFKSGTNFLLSSIGFVGISFWTYSIYSQTKFSQPIVGESIKLLGKQSKIKELVGYPLSYSFSLGNRFVEKDGDSYFSFDVRGPRSKISVEMTTTNIPITDLYVLEQNGRNPKITDLQLQMGLLKDRITELQQEIKCSPKDKRSQLQLAKLEEINKISDLKRELVELKYDIIDKKKRFFVPGKELYTQINDPRSKQNFSIINKDQQLTGINDLVITLPNRTKMIVLPEPKKTFQEKQKIVEEAHNIQEPATMSNLSKKVSIDISEFSREEIEEYGRQKTSFMYSKYSSIRMLSIMIFMGLIAGAVIYKRKTTLQSVTGSILEEEVKRLAQKNLQVSELLNRKRQFGLEFDELVGGGIANNNFKCVIYINNLTNGRLEFEGKYLPEQNLYEYSKLFLKYREKAQRKEINLLAM